MIILFHEEKKNNSYFIFAGLPPPAPPLTATSAPAPVDNNLIALLQSGGLLNFPPNPYQMQQTGAQPAPKTEQFLPGLVIPPGLSSSSSGNIHFDFTEKNVGVILISRKKCCHFYIDFTNFFSLFR